LKADRYHLYLLLQQGIERYGHRILGFCCMTNHIHLAVQVANEPLRISRASRNPCSIPRRIVAMNFANTAPSSSPGRWALNASKKPVERLTMRSAVASVLMTRASIEM